MELEAGLAILQARRKEASGGKGQDTSLACPCCPDGTPVCVFITKEGRENESGKQGGLPEESGGTAGCDALNVLRQMNTLELLNLLTALQGERVETYSSYNKAIAVLVREGRVDEYPMLCGETTSIFSVLSRRIIDIKEVFVERSELSIAGLVQSLQEKEKEKLILVAAQHLDILRAYLPDVPLSSNNSTMTLFSSPDSHRRVAEIENDVSEIVNELVAAKADLF
jgi:hypothetical protein